jgi:hypothetical protein
MPSSKRKHLQEVSKRRADAEFKSKIHPELNQTAQTVSTRKRLPVGQNTGDSFGPNDSKTPKPPVALSLDMEDILLTLEKFYDENPKMLRLNLAQFYCGEIFCCRFYKMPNYHQQIFAGVINKGSQFIKSFILFDINIGQSNIFWANVNKSHSHWPDLNSLCLGKLHMNEDSVNFVVSNVTAVGSKVNTLWLRGLKYPVYKDRLFLYKSIQNSSNVLKSVFFEDLVLNETEMATNFFMMITKMDGLKSLVLKTCHFNSDVLNQMFPKAYLE